MRRSHAMPFGAQLQPDGSVRFRLWAPGAALVELELSYDTRRAGVALQPCAEGWHEARLAQVPAGARYAYRIDSGLVVPDPASRYNPDDVHGPSMLIDPLAFEWSDAHWRGRPWSEAVVYELHVGTFTPAGTFRAALERLDYLVDLGVTAIELMPVADFPGTRNWGYDGVLPFAPDAAYGTPEDLKMLVQEAHARGLMVLLDVVYNHFGPEGNYLHVYAPSFFNPQHRTPWGAAINFDGPQARTVRDFFIHNALYWLEEYHMDGLRLDAVHAIVDESRPDIVTELCAAVRAGPAASRHVHIVLENDHNQARYLGRDSAHRPLLASAQWNDDLHHAAHVLLTGEHDGYYADYAQRPLWYLGRCLAEGFGFQGESSPFRGGAARGEPCTHLPAGAFVDFLQTHDQVGNRAFGDRIGMLARPERLRALVACVLLAPPVPMLFMGEEFAAPSPFLFFCDFGPELAQAVSNGRRAEFGRFAQFRDPAAQAAIPDPNDPRTFLRSKLPWDAVHQAAHADCLRLYRDCLELRQARIAPLLEAQPPGGSFRIEAEQLLSVDWTLAAEASLHLRANLGDADSPLFDAPAGETLFASHLARITQAGHRVLPPWAVVVTLHQPTPR